MPRIVRGGLIQATLSEPATAGVEKIKKSMIDKHVEMIAKAADQGAQVICLQELFYGPYFCAEQDIRWYDLTEPIPDGPTTRWAQELAKKSPVAVRIAKIAFYASEDMTYEQQFAYMNEAFARLCSADDAKEGVKAFFEKRHPNWQER